MTAHRCANCGNVCHSTRKLSDWELEELRAKAIQIMAAHPPTRQMGGRWSQLRGLAASYDINLRTLYRYLERAA